MDCKPRQVKKYEFIYQAALENPTYSDVVQVETKALPLKSLAIETTWLCHRERKRFCFRFRNDESTIPSSLQCYRKGEENDLQISRL